MAQWYGLTQEEVLKRLAPTGPGLNRERGRKKGWKHMGKMF